MNLLERIIACSTDEEVEKIITEEIKNKDLNSTYVGQLGFLDYGKCNYLFKGFIPLKTRIRYNSLAIETYSMQTTDFFYEFADFIKKYEINNNKKLIYNLEHFINSYFGFPRKFKRKKIFHDIAWNTTNTDDEYFKALESNKIGDLKGKYAAQCTEKSALAQQILSLFGMEIYYCMGCVDLGYKQEEHCFNIVKRKKDYALLDYTIPVISYNQDRNIKNFYPFVGEMSNDEFEQFVNNGILKSFDNYEYIEGGQKIIINTKRSYIVGNFEIQKDDNIMKR